MFFACAGLWVRIVNMRKQRRLSPELPELVDYRLSLQSRITTSWQPPLNCEDKRANFIFRIQSSGQLTNLRLLVSSGDKTFDESGRNAIIDSAPFEPLPEVAGCETDAQYSFGDGSRPGCCNLRFY
jgi:hypothetical protein